MALREILAQFDLKVGGRENLKAAHKEVEGAKSSIKELGTLLVAGFALGKIVESFKAFDELAVSIDHTSKRLGISTDSLQQWQYMAGQSGVETDALNTSLGILQRNAAKAGEGNAKTGGAFQKLGIDVRDAKGNFKDTGALLDEVGKKIGDLKSPIERTGAARDLFGRGGIALVPLLSKSTDALEEMKREFRDLGGGVSADAVHGLAKVEEAGKKWDVSLNAIRSQLVVSFLPAITTGITKLATFAAHVSKNKEAMNALRLGAVAVGLAVATAGLVAIAPWLPVLALFAGLVLIADDVRVGLAGGRSALGGVIDKLFGAGAGKSFFAKAKADFLELWAEIKGKSIDEALDVIETKLSAAGARAGDAFVKAFKNALISLPDAIENLGPEGFVKADRKIGDVLIRGAGGTPDADKRPPEQESKLSRGLQGAGEAAFQAVVPLAGINNLATQIEKLSGLSKDGGPKPTIPADATIGDLRALVEGIAKKPADVHVSAQTTVTIDASGGDPEAVADGAKRGVAAGYDAAKAALGRRAQ